MISGIWFALRRRPQRSRPELWYEMWAGEKGVTTSLTTLYSLSSLFLKRPTEIKWRALLFCRSHLLCKSLVSYCDSQSKTLWFLWWHFGSVDVALWTRLAAAMVLRLMKIFKSAVWWWWFFWVGLSLKLCLLPSFPLSSVFLCLVEFSVLAGWFSSTGRSCWEMTHDFLNVLQSCSVLSSQGNNVSVRS